MTGGSELKRRSTPASYTAVAGTVVAGLAFAGIATTGTGAQTETDPGVTAKAVKLGYIFSETGVAGSDLQERGQGVPGAGRPENANGGVNGRKIDLEIVDDASSGANLTATQDLVRTATSSRS